MKLRTIRALAKRQEAKKKGLREYRLYRSRKLAGARNSTRG
jgi:hypothetical protein